MSNTYTGYKSPKHKIPFLAIWVVLFFGISVQVVQAQYFDLRIGTERYYNEWGNGVAPLLGISTGMRDNPVYLFERVIDEVVVNDTTWAVVEIDVYHSSYSPSLNGIYTTNRKDTVLQRMDGAKLIEFKNGVSSVLTDFNLAVGDTIDIALEDYQNSYWTDLLRSQSPRPVIFADTTIIFPDESRRRIVFGDAKSSHLFGGYEFTMSVLDFVENAMPVQFNMPYPFNVQGTDYSNIAPFYYIEGAGIMFSVYSQRDGLYMIGYNPVDGPMMGTFEDAPEVTSMESNDELPNQLVIRNYPNPFNPLTNLEIEVPVSGQAQIHVYNEIGQQVAQLHNGMLMIGVHRVPFNAESLSSGVYIVRIIQGELVQSHRVMLLK